MPDATAKKKFSCPSRGRCGGIVKGMIVSGINSSHCFCLIPLTIIPLTMFRPDSTESVCQSTAQ
jgi:hypothetical protein